MNGASGEAAGPAGAARVLVRREIVLAVALAVAFRVAFGLTSARFVGGDEEWYATVGEAYAGGPPIADWFRRPPGEPLLVAACHVVAGDDALGLVRVVHAALGGAATALVALVAARAAPAARWAPAAAAWFHALDPSAVETASRIRSENLAVPLTLLFALLALRCLDAPSLRRGAAMGATAAALLWTRLDGAIALVACGGAAFVAGAVAGGARRIVVPWIAAGAACAALFAPWAFVMTRAARTQSVGAAAAVTIVPKAGLGRWLTTVDLPRSQWLELWWRRAGEADVDVTDPRIADSPDEAARVAALFARCRADGGITAATDAGFRALGDERAARHPLRTFAWFPVVRAARIWLDPADTDVPRNLVPEETTGRARVFALAWAAFSVVAGAGFVAAHAAWFRAGAALAVCAATVVVSTYALTGFVPLVWVRPSVEARYAAALRPLAAIVLCAAAAGAWSALRRGRGGHGVAGSAREEPQ